MNKLNIFSIEEMIFRNKKAKEVLWREYSKYFMEYEFLKSTGIEKSVLLKLYTQFLKNFEKNLQKNEYLGKIFSDPVYISYNFKESIYTVNIIINNGMNDNKSGKHLVGMDNINNVDETSKKFDNLIKIFPNFTLSRSKNDAKITFWR